MGIDINTYLSTQGINTIASSKILAEEIAISGSENFEKTLAEASEKLTQVSEQSAKLNEMQGLLDSLDKTILGRVADSINTEELAEELLSNPEESKDVMSELMNGQMSAIVMTDSDDSEDADDAVNTSISDSLSGEATTETLAQNLETIMASINSTSAQ